jgi:hypothetical protein
MEGKSKFESLRDAFEAIDNAILEIEDMNWGDQIDVFEEALFHLEQAREALRRTN